MRKAAHRMIVLVPALMAAACSSEESAPVPAPSPLVVGVSCDGALVPQIARLTIVAEAGGRIVAQKKWSTAAGEAALAHELALPAGVEGRSVDVRVIAEGPEATPLLQRLARTVVAPGPTKLLRLRLNDECLPSSDELDVACPGATCVAGFCEDPYVPAGDLELYEQDWHEPIADACAPEPDAEPTVVIGRDGEPFTPLSPGDSLVAVQGLQGGTHVWIAVQMKQLQADSITLLTSDFPDSGAVGSIQKTPVSYAPVEGGCELQHVRYVLPFNDAHDTTMRLGVTVVDGTGNAHHEHVDVFVAAPE